METLREAVRSASARATLIALVVVAALTLASPAGAYVYWSNYSDTIGRANPDGAGIDQAFVTGPSAAFEISVNSKHVYWADYDGNSIGRAKIDGTGVDEDFIPADGPRGIALDGRHLYWTTSPGTIGRANLDGGNVDQSFITGLSIPYGLDVDANHIYWANYGTDSIGRANVDGTGATSNLFATPGTPQGIEVGNGHIYWADYDQTGSAIGRANLDGSNRNDTFIGGLSNPYGIAVDKRHIYWLDRSESIGRANIDGSGLNPTFITGLNGPWGIAVDALPDRRSPKTRITDAPPKKTGKSNIRISFKSSERGSSFECRLGRSKWRNCRSPEELKNLDRGKYVFEVRATDRAGNTDATPAKARFKVVR